MSPPRDQIYRRLGYVKGATEVHLRMREETEQYIQEALTFIVLKGAAVRLPISEVGKKEVILVSDVILKSENLARFLTGCREIIMMGATAGEEIVKIIREESAGRNVTRSVVFDATASEMVDASLNWIMAYFSRSLRKENARLLKRRFSAGYGDFSLENQKIMFEVLELHRIGVHITEHFLLIPEKSVTAVTGVT